MARHAGGPPDRWLGWSDSASCLPSLQVRPRNADFAMALLCTPGTMVLTRPRCVPRPASAAFQRPVPDLGPALHSFPSDRQDDGASTKGSLSFARPSFSSPVALGRNEDSSA